MAGNLVPHLGAIIARPRGTRPSGNEDYRRYAAVVDTTAIIAGNYDVSHKRVRYDVGRRYESVGACLQAASDAWALFEASHENSPGLVEEFTGLAKKYSNFSGRFERSSLVGVVERIARGLAAWSLYPGVTGRDLAAGQPIHISALDVWTAPVEANRSHVFIPRVVDTQITPEVFSVLVFAVAGEGGRVATDRLQVDANSNQPYVPDVDSDAFPRACVDALRVLGTNFAESGAGDLFALGVTRGLHKSLTVVAHTEDGGLVRSVLRRGAFEPPYGAIHGGLAQYVGLPALTAASEVAVGAWCDSLALATAALVAHCDPGLVRGGDWFPSVYTQTDTDHPIVEPGGHQAGTPAGRRVVRNAFAADFPRFAANYTAALAKLFGFAENCGVAERLLSACGQDMPDSDHHFGLANLAPYYWVEPTSLVDPGFTGFPAEVEGFGAAAPRLTPTTQYGWEAAEVVPTGSPTHSALRLRFRSARPAHILWHFLTHRAGGLEHVTPRQLDAAGVVMPGPNDQRPRVYDRLLAQDPLPLYLWRRGASPFPAPSELLNTGVTLAVAVKHLAVDGDGDISPCHMLAKQDVAEAQVLFNVGVPVGLPNGGAIEPNSGARRARTRAAAALDQLRLRTAQFGAPDLDDLPLLATAPPLGPCGNGGPIGPGAEGHEAGGATGGPVRSGDSGYYNPRPPMARAGRVQPTVLHGPSHGPQPPRPTPGQSTGGGGGGAPPPGGSGGGPAGGGDGPTHPPASGGGGAAVPRPPPGPAGMRSLTPHARLPPPQPRDARGRWMSPHRADKAAAPALAATPPTLTPPQTVADAAGGDQDAPNAGPAGAAPAQGDGAGEA